MAPPVVQRDAALGARVWQPYCRLVEVLRQVAPVLNSADRDVVDGVLLAVS